MNDFWIARGARQVLSQKESKALQPMPPGAMAALTRNAKPNGVAAFAPSAESGGYTATEGYELAPAHVREAFNPRDI